MDEPQEPKMTPFDQMINDDSLQMLKASIPYVPLQMQGFLSVFAKIKELQNVLSLSRRPPNVRMMSQGAHSSSLLDMLQDIGHYANGSMKGAFEGLSSALSMMQLFQSFQGMNQDMNVQDIMGAFNMGGSNMGGFNMGGFNMDPFNMDPFNMNSTNADSFNANSFNADSSNADSYNTGSYNADSYNTGSYNKESYNRNTEKDFFDGNPSDENSFNMDSFNRASFDRDTFNRNSSDQRPFNQYQKGDGEYE